MMKTQNESDQSSSNAAPPCSLPLLMANAATQRPPHMVSYRCIAGTTQTIVFSVPEPPATAASPGPMRPSMRQHEERLFQLDLGVVLTRCVDVRVCFDVAHGGLGPASESLRSAGELFVYATDAWQERVCNFRFYRQVKASECDAVGRAFEAEIVSRTAEKAAEDRRGSSKALTSGHAVRPGAIAADLRRALGEEDGGGDSSVDVVPPPRSAADQQQQLLTRICPGLASVFKFSKLSGTLFLALFAPVPVRDVHIVCYINDEAHHPVRAQDDDLYLWGAARQYTVAPTTYVNVVRWLGERRQAMIVGWENLVDPVNGDTPLHVACAHCADPKIVTLMLVHLGRFVDPDAVNKAGESALMLLFSRGKGRSDPKHPQYHRLLQLIELLVDRCALKCDTQDNATGNTVLHYAAMDYRIRSKALQTMLAVAGTARALSIRNLHGRTPTEEASLPVHGLLAHEVERVERMCHDAADAASAATSAALLLADAAQSTGGLAGGSGVVVSTVHGRKLPSMDRLPIVDAPEDEATTSNSTSGSSPFSLPPPLAIDAATHYSPSSTAALKGTAPRKGGPLLNTAKLRAEFDRLDTNQDGWLSRGELRTAYSLYDSMGVKESATEIDGLVDSLGIAADGKVTFDEFVLLILKLTRR